MGRFLLGFAIGAVIGIATVIISAPRSGAETRHSLSEILKGALEAARLAAAAREQELWAEFRARLEQKDVVSLEDKAAKALPDIEGV
jgi:gas vesicle protein